MKHIIRYTAMAFAALLAMACGRDEQTARNGAGEPIILHVAGTRAANSYPVADYFTVSPEAMVAMGTATATYVYVYEDGSLAIGDPDRADDFRFPIDGSAVNITVSWPVGYTAPIPDQSIKSSFLLSDALQDVMSGVEPTTGSIPVYFSHVNSLVTFECTDLSLQITALSIGGYDAWCDPSLKTAQIILAPADAPAAIAAEAVGSATVTDGIAPRTVSFKLGAVPAAADYTPGSNHTITLTL